METDTSYRQKNIQAHYERLEDGIARWIHTFDFTKSQFTKKIDKVEHMVIEKVKEVAEETRRISQEVLKETAERAEKLKEKIQESSECFSTQEKTEQKLTDYDRKVEKLHGELNSLEKIDFHMLRCSHVDDFINNCEQLINVHPDDKGNAAGNSHWLCTDSIYIEQSRRQSIASSSCLSVSGKTSPKYRDVSLFSHASDPKVTVYENEDTIGTNHPEEDATDKYFGTDYVNEPIVTGIEKLSSACISGEDYGTIKAITVSDKDKIVALDTDQRAYFISFEKSDKSNTFIKQSKLHPKDYPHDVEFLESQENIITPVTCGYDHYMLRVLSLGGNKTLQKIESTPFKCTMRQHCVSVRKKRDGCFVACIACPKEIRLISYTKNGKISREHSQRAVHINDQFMDESLKHERYTVKLDEDATEAYVIKSDKQSLNCFLLESESLGKTKWLYDYENMILSDLCVYKKHVFVTDNANGKILEFEAAFGILIQKIDLHPYDISSPFAITMKHNQIFLSEYTDSWGRHKMFKKRKTITILGFQDTKTT